MKHLQNVQNLNVNHKRVFLRADLNVPLTDGVITNDFKLNALRPTLDYLLEHQATIILATHIGKPPYTSPPARGEGFAKQNVSNHSTKHLVPWFKAHGYNIQFEPDLEKAKNIRNQQIVLLENLRFWGELTASTAFAQELALLADLYVNDAFGVTHRNDTSVTLLPEQFTPETRAMGLLMQREITQLSTIKNHPKQPYIMVLGGKKLNEKVGKLSSLFDLKPEQRPQKLLLGSAIDAELIKDFVAQAKAAGIMVEVPVDATTLDIGPQTIKIYTQEIAQAKTIFVNGTMGIYEQEASAHGTKMILQAIASSNAYTVVGGGDAVAAVHAFGFEHDIDFMSTGGGAALAFLTSLDENRL